MTGSITPLRISPGGTPDNHPSIATARQLIQPPEPTVVFASGGRATVLRRETPAGTMQLDVWPSRQEDS